MEFIVVALWLVHSILPRLWPCNLLAELLLIVEIPHRTCPCVVICASGAYVLMTEYFRTFLWSEDKLYGLLLASQSDFFQTIAMPFHSNLSETSQWQSTSTWEPDLIIIRDQKWGKFPTSKRYLERMWEVIAWLTMSISVLTFQAAMASTLLVQGTIGQFFFSHIPFLLTVSSNYSGSRAHHILKTWGCFTTCRLYTYGMYHYAGGIMCVGEHRIKIFDLLTIELFGIDLQVLMVTITSFFIITRRKI